MAANQYENSSTTSSHNQNKILFLTFKCLNLKYSSAVEQKTPSLSHKAHDCCDLTLSNVWQQLLGRHQGLVKQFKRCLYAIKEFLL
jgi:hypothetical protein